MKVDEVSLAELSVLTTRNLATSTVEIIFTLRGITITASMRCPQQLKNEQETQDKILTYLGFSNDQIQGLHYD